MILRVFLGEEGGQEGRNNKGGPENNRLMYGYFQGPDFLLAWPCYEETWGDSFQISVYTTTIPGFLRKPPEILFTNTRFSIFTDLILVIPSGPRYCLQERTESAPQSLDIVESQTPHFIRESMDIGVQRAGSWGERNPVSAISHLCLVFFFLFLIFR